MNMSRSSSCLMAFRPGSMTWCGSSPMPDAGGLNYTAALLKRMGDKGWELVNIVPLGDKEGPRYGVFKRSWLSDFEE